MQQVMNWRRAVSGDGGDLEGVVPGLLGDRPVQIRVVHSAGGDPMSSVGLLDRVSVGDALDAIGDAAALVHDKLKDLAPTKASVEFGVSFSVQGGQLTALLFDGKADASLTICLEWERAPTTASADVG
jgi:hypothetical protein